MIKIGIIGYGQLARMLIAAGDPLGFEFNLLATGEIENNVNAQHNLFTLDNIQLFIEQSDIITFETENISDDILEQISTHPCVSPRPDTIKICQNRFLEKSLFDELKISCPRYKLIRNRDDLNSLQTELGFPFVLKTTRGGYDGKGQAVVRDNNDLKNFSDQYQGRELIAEEYIRFDREVSLIASCSTNKDITFFPPTENIHEQGILRITKPAHLDNLALKTAKSMLEKLCTNLDYCGVICLEMFMRDNELIANEIAPRVHNSGHWTINGANISQFEAHIRAITNTPMKEITSQDSIMANIIGEVPPLHKALSKKEAFIHLYHKAPKPNRKLGHITCVNNLEENLSWLLSLCPLDTINQRYPKPSFYRHPHDK